MTNTSKPALAVLALGGTLALGSIAAAQGRISDEQARRIALDHVPGTVIDLEHDDEDGTPRIEVEVRGEDGRVHEVTVDARDGRVIDIEEEDDDD